MQLSPQVQFSQVQLGLLHFTGSLNFIDVFIIDVLKFDTTKLQPLAGPGVIWLWVRFI